MSRPRFLADNDVRDAIVEGLLRREPAAQFVRARDVGRREHRTRNCWNTPRARG